DEMARLHAATRAVLREWIDRIRAEAGGDFPEGVTAFRPGMVVHGRYGKPCPTCGAPVQRIVYAENETNYCARCQTGGKLLADRALSRLLHDDWPRTVDALEQRRSRPCTPPLRSASHSAVVSRRPRWSSASAWRKSSGTSRRGWPRGTPEISFRSSAPAPPSPPASRSGPASPACSSAARRPSRWRRPPSTICPE